MRAVFSTVYCYREVDVRRLRQLLDSDMSDPRSRIELCDLLLVLHHHDKLMHELETIRDFLYYNH